MRGTMPIVTCDHESGCDEYTIDYWSMGATPWETPGWKYDPYHYNDDALCPEHAKVADEGRAGV